MPYHDNKKTAEDIFKEIIVKDEYRLRHLVNKEIDYIIDIGANHGFFSLFARCLFPTAQIHAIEPDINTYASLINNVDNFNILTHSVALGDGTTVSTAAGIDRPDSGSRVTITSVLGDVPSYPLADILGICDVPLASRYIIKIDCEGGERFILGDSLAENVITRSVQTMLEVHVGRKEWPQCPKAFIWEQWLTCLDEDEKINILHKKIGKKLGKIIIKGLVK